MKLYSWITNLQTYIKDIYLEHFLWNCPQVNSIIPHWQLVDIGSDNGLVPSGIKPLPELTKATRMPAFWGSPPPHPPPPPMITITHTIELYWIPSQNKTKSKLQIERIHQNFKHFNLETKITRDTPSAWQDVQIWNGSYEYCWRCRVDTILSTDRQKDRRTDRQTNGRTRWNQYTPLSTSLKQGV